MQKCKKLYRGLDMRILTCYNNIMHPGIAKVVSRLVWERVTPPTRRRNPKTRNPLQLLEFPHFPLSAICSNMGL